VLFDSLEKYSRINQLISVEPLIAVVRHIKLPILHRLHHWYTDKRSKESLYGVLSKVFGRYKFSHVFLSYHSFQRRPADITLQDNSLSCQMHTGVIVVQVVLRFA